MDFLVGLVPNNIVKAMGDGDMLTARLGFDVLKQLGAYVLVVLGPIALHQFGVYSLTVA